MWYSKGLTSIIKENHQSNRQNLIYAHIMQLVYQDDNSEGRRHLFLRTHVIEIMTKEVGAVTQ